MIIATIAYNDFNVNIFDLLFHRIIFVIIIICLQQNQQRSNNNIIKRIKINKTVYIGWSIIIFLKFKFNI